jgi:hypothetical protein
MIRSQSAKLPSFFCILCNLYNISNINKAPRFAFSFFFSKKKKENEKEGNGHLATSKLYRVLTVVYKVFHVGLCFDRISLKWVNSSSSNYCLMKFVADIEIHRISRPALEVNTQKMCYRFARVGHLSGIYSNLE